MPSSEANPQWHTPDAKLKQKYRQNNDHQLSQDAEALGNPHIISGGTVKTSLSADKKGFLMHDSGNERTHKSLAP